MVVIERVDDFPETLDDEEGGAKMLELFKKTLQSFHVAKN